MAKQEQESNLKEKRFLNLTDFFLIKCKRCGSENIEISVEECSECGDSVKGECNDCHLEYKYHNFAKLTEEEIKYKLSLEATHH